MANFHNYYVLCPLIDQKSFLGVSSDTDEDHVIVTLGRNVVNKYRLSDQKQVAGWTSKDHITSTVIYDKEGDCYAAIFNNNTIKTWKAEVNSLEKLKKIKLPVQILKIIQNPDHSFVIFVNGTCVSLPHLLGNIKSYKCNKSTIKENQTILNSACYVVNNTIYLCHILKDSKDDYEILTCPLKEESGELNRSKLSLSKVFRSDDVEVVGHLIVPDKKGVYFVWSDGKLTFYDFTTEAWKTIGSIPWVSTVSAVSIAWIGQNHIILFGNNADQDGAVLVAYNTELGIASRKYPMKMYSDGAKLYCFGGRIILEASNHIGVISFTLEMKRNLASIMGSHELTSSDRTVICDWGTPLQPFYKTNDVMKDLFNIGLSERNICSQVMGPLLEKEDYILVFNTLREFSDVPESILALTLKYIIKLINPQIIDVTDLQALDKFCNGSGDVKDKLCLLDHLLKISYSDALLFPHLRNQLCIDDAIFLLSYITCLLIGSDDIFGDDYEKKLADWFTTLLDAFYQQIIITKDEKISHVLQNARDVVLKLIDHLMSINALLPAINKVLSGKSNVENDDISSYSIELMRL